MKTKSNLFFNFKYSLNNSYEQNELCVNKLVNTKLDGLKISTDVFCSEILSNYFDALTVTTIKNNNSALLEKFVRFVPYEYFDEGQCKYILRFFALSDTHTLYELNMQTLIFSFAFIFLTKPRIFESKSVVYFSDNENTIKIENANVVTTCSMPHIKTFLFDESYLYFSVYDNPEKIYFCQENELKDLSANLQQYDYKKTDNEDGEILKIVNLKNKIYIFTKYSILRYDIIDKKISKVLGINFLIYDNSIQTIKDYIIFCSSSGLYYFDGNDIKKISNYNFKPNGFKSICFNDCYYCSESSAESILKFNPDSNCFSEIKFNSIVDFYAIKTYSCYNFALCLYAENKYENITIYNTEFANNIDQLVKFKTLILGSGAQKQIQDLYVKATGNFTLHIKSDTEDIRLNISGVTTIRNIHICGVCFDFEIESNSQFCLESILANIIEIGE